MNVQNSRRRPGPLPRRAIETLPGRSKVDETYDQLLSLAHRLGPHAKMPTVRALREEMNVSQVTLDAALSRLEDQNVVIRRQGSGVYVSARLRMRNIVLLCNPEYFLLNGASPFWRLLVNHIRDLAERNDAHLSLQFLRPASGEELGQSRDPSFVPTVLQEEIATGAVHGVISVGVLHNVARWIEAQGVPVVAYAGAAEYMIEQSNTSVVQMGVAALARQGCKRIDLWFHGAETSLANENPIHPVYTIYRGAMLSHGLTPSSPIVKVDRDGLRTNPEDESTMYYERALRHYARDITFGGAPIGLVSTDDIKTQSLLMAMYRLGLRPQRDIKIATHANAGSPALLGWHPEITRLEYNPAEIVRLLFETLEALMNNEPPLWLPRAVRVPQCVCLIEPSLILPEGVTE